MSYHATEQEAVAAATRALERAHGRPANWLDPNPRALFAVVYLDEHPERDTRGSYGYRVTAGTRDLHPAATAALGVVNQDRTYERLSAPRRHPGIERSMSMNATAAQDRAARGAALLDETTPGWWRRVDEEALTRRDVLVQLFGPFNTDAAVRRLFPDSYRADPMAALAALALYGYAASEPRFRPGLDHAWRREVVARRKGADKR